MLYFPHSACWFHAGRSEPLADFLHVHCWTKKGNGRIPWDRDGNLYRACSFPPNEKEEKQGKGNSAILKLRNVCLPNEDRIWLGGYCYGHRCRVF